MAEGGGGGVEVRVVRCPNCDRLLPELPNFSFYRCGGCHATLRSRKRVSVRGSSSKEADGGKVEYVDYLKGSSEKRSVVPSVDLEVGQESLRVGIKREERMLLVTNSDALKQRNSSSGPSFGGGADDSEKAGCHSSQSRATEPGINVDELIKENNEENRTKDFDGEHADRYQRFQHRLELKGEGRNKALTIRGVHTDQMKDMRDKGSSHHIKSTFEYGDGSSVKMPNGSGTDGVEYPDQNPVELLKKLDKLRYQLSRSRSTMDRPKDRILDNRKEASSSFNNRGHGAWLPDGSLLSNRTSARRSAYMNERSAYTNDDNMGMPELKAPQHARYNVPGFVEPFGLRSLRRAPHHPSSQYSERSINNNLHRKFGRDPTISYHQNGFYHQDACSHLHGRNRYRMMPSQASSSVLSSQRALYVVENRVFRPMDGPSMLGSQNHRQRIADSSLRSNKLPKIHMLVAKQQANLRCGSCSQVISLDFDGKRLISSVTPPAMPVIEISSSSNDGKDKGLNCHDYISGHTATCFSEGNDRPESSNEKLPLPPSPVYNLEVPERETEVIFGESETMHQHPTSASTSENVESSGVITCPRDVSSSAELPFDADIISSHVPGPRFLEHSGDQFSDFLLGVPGNENNIKHSKQEKILPLNDDIKQNSVQEVHMESSMDLSVVESTKPCSSQNHEKITEVSSCVPGLPLFDHSGDPLCDCLVGSYGNECECKHPDHVKIVSVNGNNKQKVELGFEMDLSVDESSNSVLFQDQQKLADVTKRVPNLQLGEHFGDQYAVDSSRDEDNNKYSDRENVGYSHGNIQQNFMKSAEVEIEMDLSVDELSNLDLSRDQEKMSEVTSQFPGLPLCEHSGDPLPDHIQDQSQKKCKNGCSDREKVISIDGNIEQNLIKDAQDIVKVVDLTSHIPALALCEHFGDSLSGDVVDDSGKESKCKTVYQERKIVYIDSNVEQNSIKDIQVVEAEMDLLIDKSPNSDFSQYQEKNPDLFQDQEIISEATSNVSGAPLFENFGHQFSNHLVDHSGNESKSKHTDQEKILPIDDSIEHNSAKDVPLVKQMDLSIDELSTQLSEDKKKIDEVTSQFPGFPLHEHFWDPMYDQAVDIFGFKSDCEISDQEIIISRGGNVKQNTVNDVQVKTLTCLSDDELPNLDLSQDSCRISKDDSQNRISKGGNSFFAGLIKRSFRDLSIFNRSAEDGRPKVSVNGHPLPDLLVRKAEKKAGHIYPGEYWYDSHAGFWGVMGHPCLGIIPPFIKEFNYPMPKNCAGGNTGVTVNGRELHQKDLDLLISKGLKGTASRAYIIEFSGKIFDEVSGADLGSLGKLAPTVEKLRCGFGMQVP